MGLGQRDIINPDAMGSRAWHKFAHVLRDLNFVNSMGNVGIAQLPEIMNSVASNGLRASMASMSSMRNLRRMARNGEITDEIFQELQAFTHAGEMLGGGFSRSYKVNDSMGITTARGAYQRAMGAARSLTAGDMGVQIGNVKIPLNPAGIAPMDEMLRMGHVLGTLTNWVNKAYDVKGGRAITNSFWSKSRNRFRDLGLSDEEVDQIMEALTDPNVVGVTKGMVTGKKIASLNLMNMEKGLRNKLQFALRRDADRVIQRNKVGNLSAWTQTITGGLITQFRKFAINATQKQLAYNLKHADGIALKTVAGTGVLAYVGYVINTYIGSSKYSGYERKKYLENAFTNTRKVQAMITRSGMSGHIPMLLDPLWALADPDEEALLSPYIRTSGYGVNPLTGIPSYSLATDGWMSGKALIRSALHATSGGNLGDEFTEKDLRRLFRMAPMRNSLWLNKIFEEIAQNSGLEN